MTTQVMNADGANPGPDTGTGPGPLVPEYETRKQLAKRLNCSTRTIDALMHRGLPYWKPSGRLVRFPRAAVDEWLASQTTNR